MSTITRVAVCVTVPARDSFEELQYELVRRSFQSIEDAQKNVSGYRERKRASKVRLLGGAA